MKKIILFLSVCVLGSGLSAQDLKFKNLSMETGFNFSTFDYTDSQGNSSLLTDLTNTPESRTALALGFFMPSIEGLSGSIGASLDKINVKSRYLSGNSYQYLNYDFNFAAANLGLHYDLFDLEALGNQSMKAWVVQLHAGASANRIIDGYQNMNGVLVDLKERSEFENYYIDFNYGLGLRYDVPASPISLQANYRWKHGLEMEEKTDNNGGAEKYRFDTDVFSFGVLVDLVTLSQKAKQNKRHSHHNYVKKSDYNSLEERLTALEQAPKNTTTRMETSAKADPFDTFKARIFFPFNETAYYSSFEEDLEYALQLLREHPAHKLRLIGFTDRHGSEEYNMTLSRERAQVISDYFTQNGIAKARIFLNFKGAQDEIDPTYHILNRRVELIIEK